MATPSYGALHEIDGAEKLGSIQVIYRGFNESLDTWRVPGGDERVENLVFDHPLFAADGKGLIYFGEDGPRPFATDANKFALFCAAGAAWAAQHRPDVVHLHDWHAAMFLLFRDVDIPTVFTIHNLSYQGTRPLWDDESSLEAWFPGMTTDFDAIVDPAHDNCINPMAAAIRLADKVSTVSDTYAGEICRPSDPQAGFIGGEGLEELLAEARAEGRLVGILNGCEYDQPKLRRPGWLRLLGMFEAQLRDWQKRDPGSEAHRLALQRIENFPKRRPLHVLTSIGRLVAQKATLLLHGAEWNESPLERIANALERKAAILILGSGEKIFEDRLLEVTQRCPNVLFLKGYSEMLAEPVYAAGDLFLMPSSFEPCGISQMLAMRNGQPCVVHGVGGLRDTIQHGETGFIFDGDTAQEQADNFVDATLAALAQRASDPAEWKAICDRAKAQRFSWALAAERTVKELYGFTDE